MVASMTLDMVIIDCEIILVAKRDDIHQNIVETARRPKMKKGGTFRTLLLVINISTSVSAGRF